MKKTAKIGGMSCEHCERAVKAALEAIKGVEHATVSFIEGHAIIKCDECVTDELIAAAILEEEYEFLGMM